MIALICLLVALACSVVSLVSTAWLRSGPFEQGLFEECLDKASRRPANLIFAPMAGRCQSSHSGGKGGRCVGVHSCFVLQNYLFALHTTLCLCWAAEEMCACLC